MMTSFHLFSLEHSKYCQNESLKWLPMHIVNAACSNYDNQSWTNYWKVHKTWIYSWPLVHYSNMWLEIHHLSCSSNGWIDHPHFRSFSCKTITYYLNKRHTDELDSQNCQENVHQNKQERCQLEHSWNTSTYLIIAKGRTRLCLHSQYTVQVYKINTHTWPK